MRLDLPVVAEGIDSANILRMLIDKKCQFGQGHLLAKPMTGEEALIFLKEKKAMASEIVAI
jgi:EAL domain-containing protein (putative c-di-GMP-specific phosphodiesterase class I)